MTAFVASGERRTAVTDAEREKLSHHLARWQRQRHHPRQAEAGGDFVVEAALKPLKWTLAVAVRGARP